MPPVGFEPTILVSERPQTHALDPASTGIGCFIYVLVIVMYFDHTVSFFHVVDVLFPLYSFFKFCVYFPPINRKRNT
jgi:hypothetical protein